MTQNQNQDREYRCLSIRIPQVKQEEPWMKKEAN